MFKKYVSDLKAEFKGYNGKKLTQDLMAGLTVAAVALPLALAFGVSSGADAASGLVTAIVAASLSEYSPARPTRSPDLPARWRLFCCLSPRSTASPAC